MGIKKSIFYLIVPILCFSLSTACFCEDDIFVEDECIVEEGDEPVGEDVLESFGQKTVGQPDVDPDADSLLIEDMSESDVMTAAYYEEDDDDDEPGWDDPPKAPEEISQVWVSEILYDLKTAQRPRYTANITYGNAQVSFEKWECVENHGVNISNGDYQDDDICFSRFEDGKTYTYSLKITANDDDYFSAGTSVYLNGIKNMDGILSTNKKSITFNHVYTGTAICAHEYELLTVEPTCTKEGYDYRKCRYCNDVVIITNYPATGHSYFLDENLSYEETCTKPGVLVYKCENCNSQFETYLPATGHNYVYDEDASYEATCTTAGQNLYKCENEGCHAFYVNVLPASGHNFIPHVIRAASASKEGVFCYRCANDCGATQNRQTIFPFKKITLSKAKFAFTGNPIKPSFKVYDTRGKVIPESYYHTVYLSNKNVGTGTVHITFSGMYTGTLKQTFQIVKGSQSISVANTSYTFKKSEINKKAKTISLGAKAKTKLSYSSSSSYVKVSGGKATIKKGTPKGTYTVTIKAAESKNIKSATRKVKIVVK